MAAAVMLRKRLAQQEFDPNKFVQEISSGGDTYHDLLEHRLKVKNLSDETNLALKKNVYKNYAQFIETAKEISYLESEMYQLSHILTEQKGIMDEMLEMSFSAQDEVVDTKDTTTKEEPKKSIASLLDKVEGCSRVTEVPGRYIIYDTDLTELEPDSFQEIHKVHVFLLNDSLLVTTFQPNRRGPVRFKFQTLYELDSLAVVNVRDVGPVKHAFRILMFPDQRMFQANGPKTKKEWLTSLENAKKAKAAADTRKRELVHQSSRVSMVVKETTPTDDPEDPDDLDSNNPFFQEDDGDLMESSMLKVDWLMELPEDLDMCIAQRNFEDAVDLIIKTNDYLKEVPACPALKDMRARVDHRIELLTDVLIRELSVSPDRSLRGGPQVTRRPVRELIRLGRAIKACDLFLKNRSEAIKQSIRQLRIEGATTVYITKLCNVFFTHMFETGKEFRKAFSNHPGCFSAFVVWANAELKGYVNHFSRQALAKQTNLSVVAECVIIARTYCSKLSAIGLDLLFALNGLLVKGIRDALYYNKDQLIEAARHRNIEEKWYQMNLRNPSSANALVQEMVQCGIPMFPKFVTGGCFIDLSPSMVAFSKLLLAFVNDVLKLYTPEIYPDLIDIVKDVFTNHMQLLEGAVTNEKFVQERQFIIKNADYLFSTLLETLGGKIKEKVGRSPRELEVLKEDRRRISKRAEQVGVLI
ncbi:exocyst complex component 8-like [Anneissia japonica]|uniref:exocyst complex component 8-like n=1 Tax=Anneissia japonica TaxID=1529436 RepID=UPI001425A9CE|nr:exocyst complex component 8-like [Anneissia japonica]